MRILVVDNNFLPDPIGSPELVRMTRIVPEARVDVRRASENQLPQDVGSYDSIVISGSRVSINDDQPWIEGQLEMIRRAIDRGVPLFGICHGHQSIARALGGKTCVRQAAQGEYGWTKMEVLEHGRLLAGLPSEFYTFSAHNDEVCDFPMGLKPLARSRACGVQAMEMSDRPVFGIQFHPEKDLADASACFTERREGGHGATLLHPDASPKFYDPKIAETIFGNFFALCRSGPSV